MSHIMKLNEGSQKYHQVEEISDESQFKMDECSSYECSYNSPSKGYPGLFVIRSDVLIDMVVELVDVLLGVSCHLCYNNIISTKSA